MPRRNWHNRVMAQARPSALPRPRRRALPAARRALAGALLLLGPAGAMPQPAPAQTLGDPAAPDPSIPAESTGGQSAANQAASGEAVPAPAVPMRVTTDTAEYCEALANRVEHARQLRPVRAEALDQVRLLVSEGHQMCAEGLIRSGLVRLRRAWMILRADQ